MKRIVQMICLVVLCHSMSLIYALGQTSYLNDTGSPAYSTQIPIENGFIDISNGNLHMEFPLATHKQRGALSLNEKLVYDSRIWMIGHYSNSYWWPNNIPNTPNTQDGWRFVTGMETGSFSYQPTGFGQQMCYPGDDGSSGWDDTSYGTMSWTDPNGTIHNFDATYNTEDNSCPGGSNTNTLYGDTQLMAVAIRSLAILMGIQSSSTVMGRKCIRKSSTVMAITGHPTQMAISSTT